MHWSVEVVLRTEDFGILGTMLLTSEVNAKIMVSCDVTPRSRISRYEGFGEDAASIFRNVP